MVGKREAPKESSKARRDWRDKPVEQEADKDLKEGGMAGAKREQERVDKP